MSVAIREPAGGEPTPPFRRRQLRNINERALWERLHEGGPTSRAELARLTGLSKPTVSTALASLERMGLVRPAGTHTPHRGRTALLYEPDPTAGYVVGVDLGRGRLRAVAADLGGEIVGRMDAPNRATGEKLCDEVMVAARTVAEEAGIAWPAVDRVVIGTPGVVDHEADRIRYAVNLPGWGRPGVLTALREGLGADGADVAVHNDANLGALAEHRHGVGAGSRLFLYLVVGTGLGMGVVAEGRLFLGAHGAAGEIGFLPMEPGRRVTAAHGGRGGGAAGRGVLEDAVSAAAVVRTARELGMPGRITARQVFAAARAGSEPAATAVRQEAERLAHVVAAASAVLDPDLVVLGGGIGGNADLLMDPMARTLRRLTPLRPRIVVGALGEDAVLLGAVAIGLSDARERVFAQRASG